MTDNSNADASAPSNPDSCFAASNGDRVGTSPLSLTRRVKLVSKRQLRRAFELGQRLGLDILPHHFYSSIPTIQELRRETGWKNPRSLVSIAGTDLSDQLAFVAQCAAGLEDRLRRGDIYDRACAENGEEGFGQIEAELLHCFIRSRRPEGIVQVGCGVSTSVILNAAEEAGYTPTVMCIDPYPTNFLRTAARSGKITLLEQRAQDVPVDTMLGGANGGLFFVDSTHTVKPGAEVNYIVLEVLPRLAAGTYVHFHDIYFPYDYPRDILSTGLFFSAESVLLMAFLTDNRRYRLSASLAMLHYRAPNEFGRLLPNYSPQRNDHGLRASSDPGHFPSSAYLQVVEADPAA